MEMPPQDPTQPATHEPPRQHPTASQDVAPSHQTLQSHRAHIVHLLRTAQQHHVQLSLMADQKANILIGGNLILLTILYTQLGDENLSPILLVLTITAILAGTFAVLAVMPKVTTVMPGDAAFNILFFGHFRQLSSDEYLHRMHQVIADEQTVYTVMMRDLYQLGAVLDKKYRCLVYSYRSFLAGLAVTVLLLLLQLLFQLLSLWG